MNNNYVVMIFAKKTFYVFLVAVFALSSCKTVKDIAYFQNKAVNQPGKIDKHAGIVIQPKEQLSIVVSSRNLVSSMMLWLR